MEKIVLKYKWYLFFKSSMWLAPIITLFYLFKELSIFEIFIISTIYKFAVAFFEVPTGAFADKIGHRNSVILGTSIIALALLFYPLGNKFIYFTIFEILIALGAAFVSGADDSLFYDTLKQNSEEKNYVKYRGKAFQYSFLSQIIGAIVSVYLFEINEVYPFIISSILIFIGVIVFSTLKDVSNTRELNKDTSYFSQIKVTGKYVINHKRIRTIIFYSAFLSMFMASINYSYAIYFTGIGIDVIYFGYIYALFNVVALLSSRYADKIQKFTKPYSLLFLGIILFLSFLGSGLVTLEIGVIFILFQQIYRGITKTIVNKYINKAAPTEKRATIQSYYSLITTLFGGIFGILLGFIMDYINVFNTYLILAGFLLIGLIFMNTELNKNLKIKVQS